MRFYHVKDDYINFLRKYDGKVADNKHETRPYVGIVLEIGSVKYYAPFSSPKPKHKTMKNTVDFRKIAGGSYGAINFNNMIPVTNSALILIDIDKIGDDKYRRLLQNQYKAIRSDTIQIQKTANLLRELLLSDNSELSDYEIRIKQRCCDIKLLEEIYAQYDKVAAAVENMRKTAEENSLADMTLDKINEIIGKVREIGKK
ncbi:type III toxin-antitoxin system ToxN/AbiQ family toxin [bacterium]|nr:type III toxin-antitoxin system ToxN/AbiQ family toxin [bacterium]